MGQSQTVKADRPFASLFHRLSTLKISPVGVDKSQDGGLFDLAFQKGEKGIEKFKVLLPWQSGDTFFTIATCFFVVIWRIEDDEIGFSL